MTITSPTIRTCRAGAWGSAERCLEHDGLPIVNGLCVEGRPLTQMEKNVSQLMMFQTTKPAPKGTIQCVVSGGQTGVDRGAWDAAMSMDVPIDGYVPRGRKSEDGKVPDKYVCRECRSANYLKRTRKNVELADGTLILTWSPLNGGTARTHEIAVEIGKPYLVVQFGVEDFIEECGEQFGNEDFIREHAGEEQISIVVNWIRTNNVFTLNVAGPRESKVPGACKWTTLFVAAVLRLDQDR